ncbi:hypothetical protein, partial [Nonomuraea rubra]|uniref:hypothetical protein n=1 Tax=Nonomuraea rubra TaxID=46180 RepID=UPI0031E9C37D
ARRGPWANSAVPGRAADERVEEDLRLLVLLDAVVGVDARVDAVLLGARVRDQERVQLGDPAPAGRPAAS